MRRIIIGSVLLGLSGLMSSPALAQLSGEVASTGGQDGSVLVTREGQTYPILEGDPVFDGDIITTRRGGAATVAVEGCRLRLSSFEQVTVSDRMCDPGAVLPAALPDRIPEQSGLITPTRLLIGGATLGVAAALLLSDDDDDAPVSP